MAELIRNLNAETVDKLTDLVCAIHDVMKERETTVGEAVAVLCVTLAQVIQDETHDRESLIARTHFLIDDYLQKQRH